MTCSCFLRTYATTAQRGLRLTDAWLDLYRAARHAVQSCPAGHDGFNVLVPTYFGRIVYIDGYPYSLVLDEGDEVGTARLVECVSDLSEPRGETTS